MVPRMASDVTRDHEASDRRAGLTLVGGLAAVMWLSEILDALLGGDLDAYGIRPREVDGLDGILFAPFLHDGFSHLIGNTIPFLVLGAVIALGGLARVAAVTVIVMVVGGAGTWIAGPGLSLHIGASGVVFGYAAYLVARGVYSRSPLQLLTGAIVVAVWGTTLLTGLVPRAGVSWQGHLFGALGGVVAAYLVHARGRRASGVR